MLSTLPNRVSALLPDPFQITFHDVNELFGHGRSNGNHAQRFAPITVWQNGDELFVHLDVPGVASSDLDVSVEKDRLLIRGSRKPNEDRAELFHDGRFFGQFERAVTLPDWADPNSVEASLRDGVLSLKLSKKPEAQRQKIVINYFNGPCSEPQRIDATS